MTPPVRYSRPGLQAHIGYLCGQTLGADQRVGHDVVEREATLRREQGAAQAEARALIGPEPAGWAPQPGLARPEGDEGDDDES